MSYNAYFSQNDANLLRVIQQVKEQLDTLNLSVLKKQQHGILDIQQLAPALPPEPKSSIIIESLRSMRNILESVAGSLIAPHIAHEIAKYLGISV